MTIGDGGCPTMPQEELTLSHPRVSHWTAIIADLRVFILDDKLSGNHQAGSRVSKYRSNIHDRRLIHK